jgi:iron complex transport system ATP-binding protein
MLHPPRSEPSRLVVREVTLGYGDEPVVRDLSTELPDGQTTVIVGANACGKSTLLRGMARLLRPSGGAILLDGQAIATLPSRQVARTLGLLPQNPVTPEGVSVVDLVGRGRHPHQGAFRRWSRDDEAAVAQALELTDTLDLADRLVDELSGGQRQRVWIAMALAQQTDLLLLDEPTTYLDVAHQVEVLDLLADLNEARGTTIVMVLHDLNLAARYADHLVAMREGRIVAAGPPREVITEDCVRDVFAMECRVVEDPVTATPMVIPLGRRSRTLHDRRTA